ncbi:hypothetical protein TNCV_3782501 [Trichonephila clavipes]|nr:hypothetical protein TNCV_3782501 [Trichonephila clavipes]
MEVSRAVEIFQRSQSSHGLRYTKLLGDGDSRAYKAVNEMQPYGDTGLKKLECLGYVEKRMGTRLPSLKLKMKVVVVVSILEQRAKVPSRNKANYSPQVALFSLNQEPAFDCEHLSRNRTYRHISPSDNHHLCKCGHSLDPKRPFRQSCNRGRSNACHLVMTSAIADARFGRPSLLSTVWMNHLILNEWQCMQNAVVIDLTVVSVGNIPAAE